MEFLILMRLHANHAKSNFVDNVIPRTDYYIIFCRLETLANYVNKAIN